MKLHTSLLLWFLALPIVAVISYTYGGSVRVMWHDARIAALYEKLNRGLSAEEIESAVGTSPSYTITGEEARRYCEAIEEANCADVATLRIFIPKELQGLLIITMFNSKDEYIYSTIRGT